MAATTELATQDSKPISRTQPIGQGIVPRTFEEATSLANALYKTGVFSAESAGHAVAKVIIGADFGFSAPFSLMNLYVFKGNIGMEYPAMIAVVKRAGYSYKVLEQSSTKCSIQFLNRDGTEPGPPVTWTVEDTKKAGTQNMDKYPQAMLFARAFATGCRMYCADAFAGAVYSKDEIEEIKHSEPTDLPAPIESTAIQALSARLGNQNPEGELIDPLADKGPETSTEPQGAPIPYLVELGWDAEQRSDFAAFCEGKELDPDVAQENCRETGIKGSAAIYEYLETGQAGLQL